MGNQGCQILAQGLRSIERIEELPETTEINDSSISNDETQGTVYAGDNTVVVHYPTSEIVNLDLGENEITHEGAMHLFEILKKNQTVVTLNLGNYDQVQKNKIGAIGATYLRDLLKENKFLTSLDLRANVVSDKGAYQIQLGLLENQTLEHLSLSHNDISEYGMNFLKEAL